MAYRRAEQCSPPRNAPANAPPAVQKRGGYHTENPRVGGSSPPLGTICEITKPMIILIGKMYPKVKNNSIEK